MERQEKYSDVFREFRAGTSQTLREKTPAEREKYLAMLEKMLRNTDIWKKKVTLEKRYIEGDIRGELLKTLDDRLAMTELVNEFFAGSAAYWSENGETELFPKYEKLFTRDERVILLLKRLQSGEDGKTLLSREDLAEEFHMTPNGLQKYLGEMNIAEQGPESRRGFSVLGTRIRTGLRRKNNTIRSTVHPVFLTLNLSEVYFLTRILPEMMRDEKYIRYAGTMDRLAGDVYRQLSLYAVRQLGDRVSDRVKRYAKEEAAFREEASFCDLVYLEKSGAEAKLAYAGEAGNLYGRIKWNAGDAPGEKTFILRDGREMKIELDKILNIAPVGREEE